MEYRSYKEPQQIGKNKFRQVFYTGSMQYNEGTGWRHIDISLIGLNKDYWFMGKAPYSVMVPRYSDGEIIYRHNNHGFSWIPEGIRKVEGEIIDRSTAYYKDSYADGISLEVFLSNNRIKKNIVIEKPIYSTSDFIEFRFKMPFDNITGFNDGLHIRDIGELKFIHALMRLCQDDYSATYIGPVPRGR